jgi:hypothetical protein
MAALDAANWEKYYPKDLITNPTVAALAANTASDKNNFTVVVPNLKIDSSYTFQFKYVFEDGSESTQWSPSYRLNTVTESVPAAPSVTVSGGAGFIQVSLPTFPANASRVDVRVAGGIFGDGTKVADSFSAAGTKTIAAPGSASPGLQYIVTLLTVTPSKINGDPSSPTTVYVTDPAATLAIEPSVTPSTPTVSSVLGAIQLAWNGKTSTGGNQPLGFDAAKVYVGTTSNFTPSSLNQVDVLNFANGQNVLNIGVGTLVSGVALDYGTDYYVKIATTNGTDTSIAVSANGNPVRVGQVTSGDIVTIKADKIETGTLSAGAKITAGATGGKRVELSGTGDTPFAIYGTGGTKIFDYNSTSDKLTIVGDGTFSGALSAATGSFAGNITASNGLFSVNNGILTAQSGTIGGWNITGSVLESSAISSNKITLNPATPKISLIYGGVEKITIDPIEGIKDSGGNFILSPSGQLTLKGSFSLGGDSNNYWTSESGFRMGSIGSYIQYQGSSILLKSGTVSVGDDSAGNADGGGTPPNSRDANSQITLNAGTAGLQIKGIPSLGNYTKYAGGGLYTNVESNPNNTSYGMGNAARLRTIVQDYYDDQLYRGFAVYYGSRSSAPSGSTGLVGDLWVSW